MERLITAEDVAAFAELSGDRYGLHTDAEFAATKRFGEPIAHGMLTASVVSGLLFESGVIADDVEALVEVHLRFVAPVFPGDVIRDTTVLVERKPTRSGATLDRYVSTVTGREGGQVAEMEWILLRGSGSSDGSETVTSAAAVRSNRGGDTR